MEDYEKILLEQEKKYPVQGTQILPPSAQRASTVNIMDVLCKEAKFSIQTFETAVNTMDRFCNRVVCDEGWMDLIGAVCLVIASKCHEIHPLSLESLCDLHLYCTIVQIHKRVKKLERTILNTLGFALHVVVPSDFYLFYLHQTYAGKDDYVLLRQVSLYTGRVAAAMDLFYDRQPSLVAAVIIAVAVAVVVVVDDDGGAMAGSARFGHPIAEVDEFAEQLHMQVRQSAREGSPQVSSRVKDVILGPDLSTRQ